MLTRRGFPVNRELMTLEEVKAECHLSRSSVYRLMRLTDRPEAKFPEPIRIGIRNVRWRRADIETWLASRQLATGDIGRGVREGRAA